MAQDPRAPSDDSDAPTQSSVPRERLPESSSDPLLGAHLGDYVITERLGAGGMGIVYAAVQPAIGKAVAVKVLRPEVARDPSQTRALLEEAAVVARMRHRGIIDVYTFGQLPDGRQYLVMELLTGFSLYELMQQRGKFGLGEALEIFDEVLAAIGAAHRAGVVHRDLKPSNIFLVTESDGGTYVKLLDFGLAMQSANRDGASRALPELVVGTPEYMAPEQVRLDAVSPATDLYSAAVVLFQMVTGRLPFTSRSPAELVRQHLQAPPPPASRFLPSLPPRLDELLLAMLAKDPARRPQTAAEVRQIVEQLREEDEAEVSSSGRDPRAVRRDQRPFTLRLGTRFELGLSWLTPALRALREARPQRNLQLYFGDSPDLVRQLRNGQLDCAVTSARLRGEWLKQVELHEERYALVASPSALRDGKTLEPERLALADVHEDLPLFRYLVDVHPAAGEWRFARTEVVGTIAAVAYRVLEGDAVAVLPTYFIDAQLREGRLVALLPEVELQRDFFRLVWRDGHPQQAEIEALAAELAAMPLR